MGAAIAEESQGWEWEVTPRGSIKWGGRCRQPRYRHRTGKMVQEHIYNQRYLVHGSKFQRYSNRNNIYSEAKRSKTNYKLFGFAPS